MANAFFAGGSGASWDRLVEAAFNREADFALRDMPVWMQVVDTKPNRQAMPGDSVTFTIHQDLGLLGTSAVLSETVDPDAVAPQAPNRVTVSLTEYGRATLSTNVLETLNFTQADRERAVIVGRDMVDYIDQTIRGVVDGGTNSLVAAASDGTPTQGAVGTLAAGSNAGRTLFAAGVSYIRGKKVDPVIGENYLTIAHPHVLHDLMAQTSVNSWIGPHTYGGDTGATYNGSVGSFMGQEFLSTTRVKIATDGAASAKAYRSYTLGRQAVAEAVAVDPHIRIGPVVDKLNRFRPLGWYALLGYALYRPEASLQLYSTSSLGAYT